MSTHDYRPCYTCGDVTDYHTRLTCRTCGKPLLPLNSPTPMAPPPPPPTPMRTCLACGYRTVLPGATCAHCYTLLPMRDPVPNPRDRLFPLMLAACRDAIEHTEQEHRDRLRSVAQHMTFMDAITADPLPPWVAPMKRLLAEAGADPINTDPEPSPHNLTLSDDDRTKIKESTR